MTYGLSITRVPLHRGGYLRSEDDGIQSRTGNWNTTERATLDVPERVPTFNIFFARLAVLGMTVGSLLARAWLMLCFT